MSLFRGPSLQTACFVASRLHLECRAQPEADRALGVLALPAAGAMSSLLKLAPERDAGGEVRGGHEPQDKAGGGDGVAAD